MYSVIEHYGGTIRKDPVLVKEAMRRAGVSDPDSKTYSDPEYKMGKKEAQDRFLAIAFLSGSDRARYSKLVTDLENNFTRGTDQYPKDLTMAYNLLVNFKGAGPAKYDNNKRKGVGNKEREREVNTSGVSFLLTNARGEKIECYNCGGNHYSNSKECPLNKSKTASNPYLNTIIFLTTYAKSAARTDMLESTLLPDMSGILLLYTSKFVLATGPTLHRSWILLDNQSNLDIFCNKDYLINIEASSHIIRAHSNSGTQDTDRQGTLPGYGRVWYNPASIANILSFSNVEDRYKITYKKGVFRVHVSSTKTMDFKRIKNNLFAYIPCNESVSKDLFVLMQTVKGNTNGVSPEDLAKANQARRLYICLGRPSHRMFKYMLNHKLIQNTSVTAADAEQAMKLYGNDLGQLQGNTVRTHVKRVKTPDVTPLPVEIKDTIGDLTLCVDYFFVDKIPFLLSYTRKLHFLLVEHTVNKKRTTMVEHFTTVLAIYCTRGYQIGFVLGDAAFACLNDFFLRHNVHLSTTVADEHVAEIERQIRLVKEQIRAHISVSPFRYIPKLLKKKLVLGTVTSINFTVRKNSLSPLLSPMALVQGIQLDAERFCSLPFGSYCEVSKFDAPQNSTNIPHTTGAVALHPMNNFQGSYYFLCLGTWELVRRWHWQELPMPSHVIDAVNNKALDEAELQQHSRAFTFLHRDRLVITSLLTNNDHLLINLEPPEDEEARAPPFAPPVPPVALSAAPEPVDEQATVDPPPLENEGASENNKNEGAQPDMAPPIDPTTGMQAVNKTDCDRDVDQDTQSGTTLPPIVGEPDKTDSNTFEMNNTLETMIADAKEDRQDPRAKDSADHKRITLTTGTRLPPWWCLKHSLCH